MKCRAYEQPERVREGLNSLIDVKAEAITRDKIANCPVRAKSVFIHPGIQEDDEYNK
jgi:hypothetical protein